jgi:hypothetical protein
VRAATEPLLVDDDGHVEVLDGVGGRRRILRQEVPDEHAEVLVELPLRLGRDRVEHDRRLPGAGDPREDRDRVLGDRDIDAAQVVLARTADLDVAAGHRAAV